VNGVPYQVQAGFCVLAGQYPLNTQVTVQETIPAGYALIALSVQPVDRLVSKNAAQGLMVVKIGTGVTEALFKNSVAGPTPTRRPPNTPTNTPGCAPNCTATPTPATTGRLQICKEADGEGVSGSFNFRFPRKVLYVPVEYCSPILKVYSGELTVTEDARAGYVLADVYTIPADRLISKNVSGRSATVTIVPGSTASQTIIVFVNRAETTQVITNTAASSQAANPLDALLAYLKETFNSLVAPAGTTTYAQ
jgi:hypothetical protein